MKRKNRKLWLLIAVAALIVGGMSAAAYAQCYEDVVVTDAGLERVNGTYTHSGLWGDKPRYNNDSISIIWNGSMWAIFEFGGSGYVYNESTGADTPTPPATGWEVMGSGEEPAPTLSGGEATPCPPSITVEATSGLTTTEAGGTDTFTVVLDVEPSDTVTIGISSDNTGEGTVAPTALTFTTGDWDTPQTVTVTGVNDDVDDGNIAYTIVTAAAAGGDYAGIDASDVSVTNTDNDTAGITVTPTMGLTITEAGGTDTFTVVLDSEPTASVSIGISSLDASEGTAAPTTLTFTAGDWDTPQTVTVTGVDDDVDDGNIGFQINTVTTSGDAKYDVFSISNVSVTSIDDDTAGVTVTPTSGLTTTEAGGTATFTVVLDSEPALGDCGDTPAVIVLVQSDDTTEGTASPSALVFMYNQWNVPKTVTITGADDALNDGDVGYTIVVQPAAGCGYDGIDGADVSVTNTDDDVPGVTVSAISGNTNEDGTTATFTVVLDCEPGDSVTIYLLSDNQAEGTIDVDSLTFTTGDWNIPQTVTVTGVDDAAVDGDIEFTVLTSIVASADGDYLGMNPDDVLVINEDDDSFPLVIIPTGQAGPEHLLDVMIPVIEGEEPIMAGSLPLTAVHTVGDIIGGGCMILGAGGAPTCATYIHLYLYSVDIDTRPETVVLLTHWMADFNWDTLEYDFLLDTTELAPGYYDLRLVFADESVVTFRIELTEPVE